MNKPAAKRPARQARDAEMRRMRAEGRTYQEIADIFDLSAHTVWKIVNRPYVLKGRPAAKKKPAPAILKIAPADTYAERNAEIRRLRSERVPLQEIGDRYGLTRERVRQLTAGVKLDHVCGCGNTFTSAWSNAVLCGDCRCRTCGTKLSDNQAKAGTRYCTSTCDPYWKGAKHGATYRKVERGIYQREYIATGFKLDGYYVFDNDGKRYLRFSSLREARTWRRERGLA